MTMTRVSLYLHEVLEASKKIRYGKWVGLGSLVVSLFLICAGLTFGERLWFTAFLLEYGLWIFGAIAAIGVATAAATGYRLGVVGSLLGFGLGYFYMSFPALMPPGGKASGPTLTVMTFNIENNFVEKGVGHLLNLTLEDANADIILAQEARLMRDDPAFRQTFLHHYMTVTDDIALIYKPSVVEVVQVRQIDFTHLAPHQNRFGQIAVIKWKGKLFNIVHLQMRDERAEVPLEVKYPETKKKLGWSEKASPNTPVYAERLAMFNHLVGVIKKLKGPVILTGDLGFTPNGSFYPVLTSKFVDTFAEVGGGMGRTSPKGRTSYIFASKHWKPIRAYTIQTQASSHNPVVAELQLDKDESALVEVRPDPDGDGVVDDPSSKAYEEELTRQKAKDKGKESDSKAEPQGAPSDPDKSESSKPDRAEKPVQKPTKVVKVVFRRAPWAPMYGRDVARMVKKAN